MKFAKTVLILCSVFFSFQVAMAQPNVPSCLSKEKKEFNECTAAFLGSKMLVDDYSPRGKCVIEEGITGTLSVSTVNLSPFNLTAPFKSVGFKVAIRNDETNTLWLFSDEVYQEVPIEKILVECKKRG